MKRLCWMGWIGTVLLGIGLHALYAWRPIPLLGLFSPVNESVWEHLKLLYWPFLAVCGLLSPRVPSLPAFWGAACSSLLTMPPVLMGIWYTARCGFGIVSSILDMGLYCLIVALGFFLLYHLQKKPWRERQVGIAIMLAGLWGGVLLVGSAAPFDLPLFQSV